MNPSLPGWKIECVGDDIAWMKFDEQGMEIVLCMDEQDMDCFIVQYGLLLGAARHATKFWTELNYFDLLIFCHLTSRQLKGNQSRKWLFRCRSWNLSQNKSQCY